MKKRSGSLLGIDRDEFDSVSVSHVSDDKEDEQHNERNHISGEIAKKLTSFREEIKNAGDIKEILQIEERLIKEIIENAKLIGLVIDNRSEKSLRQEFNLVKEQVILEKRLKIIIDFGKWHDEQLALIMEEKEKKFNLNGRNDHERWLHAISWELDITLKKFDLFGKTSSYYLIGEIESLGKNLIEKFEKSARLFDEKSKILEGIKKEIDDFGDINFSDFSDKKLCLSEINARKDLIEKYIETQFDFLEGQGAVTACFKNECREALKERHRSIEESYLFLVSQDLRNEFNSFLSRSSLFSNSIEYDIKNIELVAEKALNELRRIFELSNGKPLPDFARNRITQIKKECINNRRNLQKENCASRINNFKDYVGNEVKAYEHKDDKYIIKKINDLAKREKVLIRKILGSDSPALTAELHKVESIRLGGLDKIQEKMDNKIPANAIQSEKPAEETKNININIKIANNPVKEKKKNVNKENLKSTDELKRSFYENGVISTKELFERFAKNYINSAEKINKKAIFFKKNNGIARVLRLTTFFNNLGNDEKNKEKVLCDQAKVITHFLQYGTLGNVTDPNGGRSLTDEFSARAFLLKELGLGVRLDQVIDTPKDKLFNRVFRQLQFLALLQPFKKFIEEGGKTKEMFYSFLSDICISHSDIIKNLRGSHKSSVSEQIWLLDLISCYCVNENNLNKFNDFCSQKNPEMKESLEKKQISEQESHLEKAKFLSIYLVARQQATPEELQSRPIKDFEHKLAKARDDKISKSAVDKIKQELINFATEINRQQNCTCFPSFFSKTVNIDGFRGNIRKGLQRAGVELSGERIDLSKSFS